MYSTIDRLETMMAMSAINFARFLNGDRQPHPASYRPWRSEGWSI
jgi:hypothetical protein